MTLNAKANPNYVAKRINGKFAPGYSGNPGGSLEATRRSFNKDFLLALADDFKKHGAAAIEKVRKQNPAAYMKICALLVPREMKLEYSGGGQAMTDEQLKRGIEIIKELIAKRDAAANAKVIEGTAQGATSAPTELQQPRRNRSNRLLEHGTPRLVPVASLSSLSKSP